jgi:hypothetical protein
MRWVCLFDRPGFVAWLLPIIEAVWHVLGILSSGRSDAISVTGDPKFSGEPATGKSRHAECTHEASGLCVEGPSVSDQALNATGL